MGSAVAGSGWPPLRAVKGNDIGSSIISAPPFLWRSSMGTSGGGAAVVGSSVAGERSAAAAGGEG